MHGILIRKLYSFGLTSASSQHAAQQISERKDAAAEEVLTWLFRIRRRCMLPRKDQFTHPCLCRRALDSCNLPVAV